MRGFGWGVWSWNHRFSREKKLSYVRCENGSKHAFFILGLSDVFVEKTHAVYFFIIMCRAEKSRQSCLAIAYDHQIMSVFLSRLCLVDGPPRYSSLRLAFSPFPSNWRQLFKFVLARILPIESWLITSNFFNQFMGFIWFLKNCLVSVSVRSWYSLYFTQAPHLRSVCVLIAHAPHAYNSIGSLKHCFPIISLNKPNTNNTLYDFFHLAYFAVHSPVHSRQLIVRWSRWMKLLSILMHKSMTTFWRFHIKKKSHYFCRGGEENERKR